jgi:hypothetical protein
MSSDNHTRGPARLLIAILGLLAATALLAAGCGGDDDEPEISTQEITGDAVEGEGYAYGLPDGWSIEQESSGTETGVDTVIISDDASGDFRVNVNVVRESGVPDDTEISEYVDAGIQQVQDSPASCGRPADATVEVVSEPADTELGGEPALDYEVLTKGEGIAASQRQIAAIHEGTAYTITLSAGEGDLEENNPVLDDIISSWSWS